jgi:hypothetical protein
VWQNPRFPPQGEEATPGLGMLGQLS